MAGCSSGPCSTVLFPVTSLASSAANLNTNCRHSYALNGRNHKFQASYDTVTSHKNFLGSVWFFPFKLFIKLKELRKILLSIKCGIDTSVFPFTKKIHLPRNALLRSRYTQKKKRVGFNIKYPLQWSKMRTRIRQQFLLIHKCKFRENPYFKQIDRNSDAIRCISFNFWMRTHENNIRFTVCDSYIIQKTTNERVIPYKLEMPT